MQRFHGHDGWRYQKEKAGEGAGRGLERDLRERVRHVRDGEIRQLRDAPVQVEGEEDELDAKRRLQFVADPIDQSHVKPQLGRSGPRLSISRGEPDGQLVLFCPRAGQNSGSLFLGKSPSREEEMQELCSTQLGILRIRRRAAVNNAFHVSPENYEQPVCDVAGLGHLQGKRIRRGQDLDVWQFTRHRPAKAPPDLAVDGPREQEHDAHDGHGDVDISPSRSRGQMVSQDGEQAQLGDAAQDSECSRQAKRIHADNVRPSPGAGEDEVEDDADADALSQALAQEVEKPELERVYVFLMAGRSGKARSPGLIRSPSMPPIAKSVWTEAFEKGFVDGRVPSVR